MHDTYIHTTGHTSLLRRGINVTEVDSTSQQRRVSSGIYTVRSIHFRRQTSRILVLPNKGTVLQTVIEIEHD